MFSTPFFLPEEQTETTPVPDDPAGEIADDCRLWIGNLDTRLTEYSLLKLLQKFGPLKRFDFLINHQGPEKGKPRGYSFVTYENRQDAETARKHMNGKLALSKRLVVKWAHVDTKDERTENKHIAAIGGKCSNGSTDSKIRAIEAKLKKMEESSEELTLSAKPAAPPGSSGLFYTNKPQQNKKPYYRKK